MKRKPPSGYVRERNEKTWNRGVLFSWSPVFEQYLLFGSITVQPNESIARALDRELHCGRIGSVDYEVFFVKGF